jgi:hypothetical protein
MPILGLFSKKDKQKASPPQAFSAGNVSPSPISEQDSAEQDYILAKRSVPASPSVNSGSDDVPGGRRKLFKRKQSKPMAVPNSHLTPPRPPQSTQSSYSSQPDHDLLRPPSRNLFTAYGDTNGALSTRSLPEAPITSRPNAGPHPSLQETYSNPDLGPSTSSLQNPDQPKRKKSGVFSWAQRERTKSKPSPPTLPELPPVPPVESFNLKSFRHVRPDSPSNLSPEMPDRPGSAMSGYMTPPPLPRSRGNSVTNDPTQRVSVALFREAQARKNTASASQVNLSRPPSRLDAPPSFPIQSRSESESGRMPARKRAPSHSATMPVHGSSLSSDSSDSDSDSDSSDSDSVEESTVRPLRNGSATPRTPQKASSEMGHLKRPSHTPSKSDSGHQMIEQSSPLRRRASRSMSAAAPNAAANRASAVANMPANPPSKSK